jgi:hypothetical protein
MILLRIFLGRFLRWSVRHTWSLVIGIVLLVVDVVGLAGSSVFFLVAGLLSVGYGVLEIVRKATDDWQRLQRIYERERPDGPVVGQYEAPYDGWEEIELNSWRAVTDARINARLINGEKTAIERTPELWLPSGRYEELRKLLRVRLDADEKKIRLSRDFLPDSATISFQQTVYSAFLVTNRLGLYKLRERGSEREILDSEEVLLRAGRIPTFDRSRCSNHLGVDVLAISSDGRILVTRQSAGNQVSRGLLAPSGSGSVDWDDLHEQDELVTLLARAMRREMCEELGLHSTETPELDSILPLGYARFSHLGGKPQFFGVARLDAANGRVRGIERRYIDDHLTIHFDPGRGVDELVQTIDKFESNHRNEMSFPLHVNFQMVRRWLATDDQAGAWLGL